MQVPDLALLDPSVVGDQVVEAIRANTFFVPTHDEVCQILLERAEDPEGYVEREIEKLGPTG